jgi:chromosomal replication initiation ATPase DnaA
MAKKGKFWSKLLTRKDGDKAQEPEGTGEAGGVKGKSETAGASSGLEVKGHELPKKECHFCYEPFTNGDDAYKCENCGSFYHHPDCIRNQPSCRACGDEIIEKDNVFRLIKLRSVICPKCGMKVKLFFESSPQLKISCPNCGHEGLLPNPYLKDLKPEDKDEDEDGEVEEDMVDSEAEDEGEKGEEGEDAEVEDKDEESVDTEDKVDDEAKDEDVWEEEELEEMEEVEEVEEVDVGAVTTSTTEPEPEEGPKIIKKDKSKRKAKLVLLDQSLTCNVCLESINSGLPVLVCKCGKKYHEKCGFDVGECPTCDGNLKDIERLLDEEPEVDTKDEPEPEAEIKIELGIDLDLKLTLDKFKADKKIILHSIALGLTDSPGQEFKLLCVFGGKDKIRTHLLHAIGNQVQNKHSDLVVRYTTMIKFFSEYAKALELGKSDEFEEFYKNADMFMIDEFHELPKKKSEQEMFFSIFDTLFDNNKQIIISSDRPVDEIQSLSKDLSKRIFSNCGLIINLMASK